MRKIHAASLAILCMCLYSGCGDNLPTGTKGSVIMPLEVGNKWIGTLTVYDYAGNVVDSYSHTIEITDVTIDNGEIWYYAKGWNFNGWYTNRKDGLYPLYAGDSCYKCLMAKYPARSLDTFNTSYLMNQDSVIQVRVGKVLSIGEHIEVPAGSFAAYQYTKVVLPQDVPLTYDKRFFFVPDIGPIRLDLYIGSSPDRYLSRRWELAKAVL